MNHKNKTLNILLIEDNLGDILLAKEACRDIDFPIKIDVVHDGEQAIDILKNKQVHTQIYYPDLILLDLNLPIFNGQEVLKFVKSHQLLKRIPVVILTTSQSEEDISKSYDFHANAYIQKPIDLEGFITMMKSLLTFWMCIVQLPPNVDAIR